MSEIQDKEKMVAFLKRAFESIFYPYHYDSFIP